MSDFQLHRGEDNGRTVTVVPPREHSSPQWDHLMCFHMYLLLETTAVGCVCLCLCEYMAMCAYMPVCVCDLCCAKIKVHFDEAIACISNSDQVKQCGCNVIP